MSRTEDLIVNCAERITRKLCKNGFIKVNGEYNKDVKMEIKKMISFCKRLEKEVDENQ